MAMLYMHVSASLTQEHTIIVFSSRNVYMYRNIFGKLNN